MCFLRRNQNLQKSVSADQSKTKDCPTEMKIISKRKTSQIAANLPRSRRPSRPSPRSERESQRNDQKPKSSISDSTGLSQQVKGRDRTVLKTLSQYGSALEGLMETTKVSSLRLFLMSSLFRFVLRHTCRPLYTETIGDVWSQSLETTKKPADGLLHLAVIEWTLNCVFQFMLESNCISVQLGSCEEQRSQTQQQVTMAEKEENQSDSTTQSKSRSKPN
ncbi:hypothetical protein CHARACLAT_006142 [Characodon lateralis]|uniref:Uncharacterized protein n=1 Tax=Characodon lateralis TaxID=208331 RepID=A0ABU7D829_9TELE|nr:hypothetical protein [Characodon lateralis]